MRSTQYVWSICPVAKALRCCALVSLLASRTMGQLCPAWKLVDGGPCEQQSRLCMSYDEARARVVLFSGSDGGPGGGTWQPDTWTWDLQGGWVVADACGPLRRTRGGMVWDEATQSTLMFGGLTPGGVFVNDLWQWDGSRWTEFVVGSGVRPAPRGAFAMAYDRVRGRVVVYGGASDPVMGVPLFDDTWEWDGNMWEKRDVPGPSARSGSCMAFDEVSSTTILFGGRGDDEFGTLLDDTWRWDGSGWTKLDPAHHPSPRRIASLHFDRTRGKLLLIGGYLGFQPPSDEVWAWTGSDWSLESRYRGASRAGHMACYDDEIARSVVFGAGAYESGLALYDRDSWINPDPRPERYPSLPTLVAFDTVRNRLIVVSVFGDRDSSGTWEWDGRNWMRAGILPESMLDASVMTFDKDRAVCVLYTSDIRSPRRSKTYLWNGVSWALASEDGPPGRESCAIAYDEFRRRVVLFGGRVGEFNLPQETLGDTWEWDGVAWTQLSPSAPCARNSAAMCYDPLRRRMVLFGGANATAPFLTDTWELAGSVWTRRSNFGPLGRTGAAAAFDSISGEVILFGGSTGGLTNDIWSWNGSHWTLVGAGGIRSRQYATLWFDPNGAGMRVFGGVNGDGALSDVWELQRAPGTAPNVRPGSVLVLPGAAVRLNVQTRCWDERTYQWRRNGVDLTDDARISGATHTTLVIANASAADDGAYTCLITDDCGEISTEPALVHITSAPCPGDISGDGVVNTADLTLVLLRFGGGAAAGDAADLNADGRIDTADLCAMLLRFGQVCH